jgi:hypothetical protein
METLDEIFMLLAGARIADAALICCFYTKNDLPDYCEPMPRDPLPVTQMLFDENFSSILDSSIALNPAIHDGAVMVGRRSIQDPYRINGWSYRLFPPSIQATSQLNRGSAFNSCLAMSRTNCIDRIYLISRGSVFRFDTNDAVSLT